ncbi:MAG: hypothetical protein HDR71_08475 [Lachnospiraceae bacterium]|nr:hypothetical protein [Lachnospiraceae bacterium]
MQEGESLKENISDEPQFNEDKIIKYLEEGVIYCVSPGLTTDILGKSNEIIDSLKILTDGEWIWPSDLSYYVKKYHVKLNEKFILHMQNAYWTVPNRQEIKLEQLEL